MCCSVMRSLIHRVYSYTFIRYSLWGWLAALLDLCLLYVFTDFLGIYYLYSAILAFVCSVTFAYIFQKYITFKNYSRKHLLQWSLFLVFQLIGQWLYMVLLWLWVDIFHIYYLLIAFWAKIIVFLWNYITNRSFNFKH